MFYSEYSGVVPDIQIMAKGIAGGLPLSAIVAKNYVMKGQKPGSMGGTYCESRETPSDRGWVLSMKVDAGSWSIARDSIAGNALACAAGMAVLETFEKENILDNVNARRVATVC